MTTKTSVASSIAALLISPAFAIEAPADNTPPPAAGKPAEASKEDGQEKKDEAPAAKPFLGLKTAPVADMVAEHLGIEAGQGVAVEVVAPDGPAAKAGIHQNDIITRLDGKAVSTHEELAEAISARNPGDKIRLDVIQKGKAREIEAVLGTRPADADLADQPVNPLENLPLHGVPKELADRIRKNIKGNVGGVQLHFLDPQEGGIEMKDMEELQKKLENLRGAKGAKGLFEIQGGFQSSVSFSDGEGSVEMKTTKDGKEVTVKDKDNKVVWSGPWDTEQDKEAAPPDARKRIEAFNMDNGNGGGLLKIIPKMINPGAEDKADEAEAPNPPEEKPDQGN